MTQQVALQRRTVGPATELKTGQKLSLAIRRNNVKAQRKLLPRVLQRKCEFIKGNCNYVLHRDKNDNVSSHIIQSSLTVSPDSKLWQEKYFNKTRNIASLRNFLLPAVLVALCNRPVTCLTSEGTSP
jgi:hypothetical protein